MSGKRTIYTCVHKLYSFVKKKGGEQSGKGKGDYKLVLKYVASLDKSHNTPSRRKREVVQ